MIRVATPDDAPAVAALLAELVEVSCGRRPVRDAAHRLYRAAGYEDAADVSVRYRKTL